jgi:uncharacterized protein YdeI (YjbR/CyaY-like superfamily)
MARLDDAERVHPRSRAHLRRWLERHHATSPGVWLVWHTKASGKQELGYDDVVEELMCFGWVDSTSGRAPDGFRSLYVAPRKKGGTWAATNKARVARLLDAGLMAPAGVDVVERAKADGSWTSLDAVEALEVPDDLAAALERHRPLREAYGRLGDGGKKQVLWSLASARRPQTRAGRLDRLVDRARDGQPLVP